MYTQVSNNQAASVQYGQLMGGAMVQPSIGYIQPVMQLVMQLMVITTMPVGPVDHVHSIPLFFAFKPV